MDPWASVAIRRQLRPDTPKPYNTFHGTSLNGTHRTDCVRGRNMRGTCLTQPVTTWNSSYTIALLVHSHSTTWAIAE
jgi:hypothetical protein